MVEIIRKEPKKCHFRNAINYVDDNAGWVRYRDIVDVINEEAEGRKESRPFFVRESIGEWTEKQMGKNHGLLFIGACGIAVRAIAPQLVDKLQDSPVLVMDEQGRFVIPLLCGHVGGANELARLLSQVSGACPVITTATDIWKKFAVDLIAKKNHLYIENKEGRKL